MIAKTAQDLIGVWNALDRKEFRMFDKNIPHTLLKIKVIWVFFLVSIANFFIYSLKRLWRAPPIENPEPQEIGVRPIDPYLGQQVASPLGTWQVIVNQT